jgi:hypothetical protein
MTSWNVCCGILGRNLLEIGYLEDRGGNWLANAIKVHVMEMDYDGVGLVMLS